MLTSQSHLQHTRLSWERECSDGAGELRAPLVENSGYRVHRSGLPGGPQQTVLQRRASKPRKTRLRSASGSPGVETNCGRSSEYSAHILYFILNISFHIESDNYFGNKHVLYFF